MVRDHRPSRVRGETAHPLMTHEHHPVDPSKRYPCDRCGVPTRSVFEGETKADYSSQLDGGLHITASGYYGGFWDTLSFMGEEPVSFHLCHDCSAWLCSEIPKMAEEAKGGHFSSNVQDEGVLHEKSKAHTDVCCKFGVVNHSQGEDHSPKERL